MTELNQIRYDTASNVIRKELPSEWTLTSTSTIYATVNDKNNTELVARASTTQYTSTTLNAATTAGDSSFVLAAGASALEPGDRVRILDSDAGGDEDIVVDYYDSSTRTVHPRRSLRSSHSSGAAVVGMFATVDIDTSDEDTWTKGLEVIVLWEHGAAEEPGYKYDTDTYKVSVIGFGSDDAIDRFRVLYSDVAETKLSVLPSIRDEAKRHLRSDLAGRGLDMDRVVQQETIMIPLLYKMGVIAFGVSDQYVTEREAAMADYTRAFDNLLALPIWVDEDQDLNEEDHEVKSHTPLTWGRGM